ncbi:MAG: oxidoreductase [Planctomycetes bacterium]|nr:oxidoreductase [Planctomycetota bacterium]
MNAKPRLAVFKFASCDGCQLQLLDAQDRLLELAGRVEIDHFLEASSRVVPGPYDMGLVEGSITTIEDEERIREVRRQCRFLVTIGACATAGGIQALRNWGRIDDFRAAIYATPETISTLATSTPIADHVPVDFELRGCPIDRGQLIDLLTAVLLGRKPHVPGHSVCVECKARGLVCVAVAKGIPCLGPVTQAGCGAICPAHDRECFGCFGPSESPNLVSLTGFYERRGTPRDSLMRLVRSFNAAAPAFRAESDRLEASE